MGVYDLYQELQSNTAGLIDAHSKSDCKKYYATLLTRLCHHTDKVKELLTATQDEKVLQYNLWLKYVMVEKTLMISSMAKPSI